MGKSDVVGNEVLNHILFSLTELNQLACYVSLTTGLRIDDVLAIKTEQVKKGSRFTVTEKKTGKKRRVSLGENLRTELLRVAGSVYVFEHRYDKNKHRTRQAVFKDLQKVCRFYRLPSQLQISPHSFRKIYAVRQFKRTCTVGTVQKLLNHESEAVTLLYAMADEITARKLLRNRTGKSRAVLLDLKKS